MDASKPKTIGAILAGCESLVRHLMETLVARTGPGLLKEEIHELAAARESVFRFRGHVFGVVPT